MVLVVIFALSKQHQKVLQTETKKVTYHAYLILLFLHVFAPLQLTAVKNFSSLKQNKTLKVQLLKNPINRYLIKIQ